MTKRSPENATKISKKLVDIPNFEYLLILQDLRGRGMEEWLKKADPSTRH